jgi:ketosteroid isomerase-like protein
MRRLPALLAAALLAAAVVACGQVSKVNGSSSLAASAGGSATPTPSSPAPSGGYLKVDGDQDDDDRAHASRAVNDDRELFETYGNSAGAADKRAVSALVKSYFAAAAAGDAAKDCSLLQADLVANLAARGASSSQGKSSGQSARAACARSMSALLAQQHRRLADEVPTMLVTGVHVRGDVGLAVLGFRRMPEGEIVVEREGNAWKVDALLDSEMT